MNISDHVQSSSSFPSAEEFLAKLHELAESDITEADIFERASNGTLHELLGLPANAFESDEEVSVYVPVDAQRPITAKEFLRETREAPQVDEHTGLGKGNSKLGHVDIRPQSEQSKGLKNRSRRVDSQSVATSSNYNTIKGFAGRAPLRFYPTHLRINQNRTGTRQA